jgi:CHAD domain-containing protein
MDVLTADVLTTEKSGEQDCLVRLIEHLGAERKRSVKKLRRAIGAAGPQLRRILKRKSKRVEQLLEHATDNPGDSQAVSLTMARILQLSSELNKPAQLSRRNLHAYRLQVKQLRDVLQLSDHPAETGLLDKLGEVKDAIGEWHDWQQLIAIAASELDHGASCKLVKGMKATSDAKYERALLLARQLRQKYLSTAAPKRRAPRGQSKLVTAPVIRATAAIVQS